MSHKISGIYKLICLKNNKFYIGSSYNIQKRITRHYSDLRNGRHHNVYLQRAWNKYGERNFTYKILKRVNKENNLEVENKLLQDLDFSKSFNIAKKSSGGDNLTNHPNRNEIIKKIAKSLSSKISSIAIEERKKIYGRKGSKNGMFGKKHSKKSVDLISEKLKGKISHKKGKSFEEYYGKKEALRIKKILSNYAKNKKGEKNPFYGKKHSEKAKKKIGKSKKGKKNTSQIKPFFINEKRYLSLKDAEKETNISYTTIRWRLKSENQKYSNYRYE